MDGKKRREDIINELVKSEEPIKGSLLAKMFNVSRQVIVQDIALLRAQGKSILSTSEGYMVYKIKENTIKRVFAINHSIEDIEDELKTIVDLGGNVLNVIVSHSLYGEINIDMMINSRKKVSDFMNKVNKKDFVPLMRLTNGEHYHTIEAESEEVLNEIQDKLKNKGYLIN
jgi:transcriptional regulator of NAD metabolism